MVLLKLFQVSKFLAFFDKFANMHWKSKYQKINFLPNYGTISSNLSIVIDDFWPATKLIIFNGCWLPSLRTEDDSIIDAFRPFHWDLYVVHINEFTHCCFSLVVCCLACSRNPSQYGLSLKFHGWRIWLSFLSSFMIYTTSSFVYACILFVFNTLVACYICPSCLLLRITFGCRNMKSFVFCLSFTPTVIIYYMSSSCASQRWQVGCISKNRSHFKCSGLFVRNFFGEIIDLSFTHLSVLNVRQQGLASGALTIELIFND